MNSVFIRLDFEGSWWFVSIVSMGGDTRDGRDVDWFTFPIPFRTEESARQWGNQLGDHVQAGVKAAGGRSTASGPPRFN